MRNILIAIAIAIFSVGGLTTGCGGAVIPAIVAGVSTVGQLIDLFTDDIKPEYAQAAE